MTAAELHSYIRASIVGTEGFLLHWRVAKGCQMMSGRYRKLLPCPYREAKWQCEVIGPHDRHQWSDHLIRHERMGNGWSCRAIDRGVNFTFHSV